MASFALVQNYIDVAQRTQRLDALTSATQETVAELGFDYFAILHHLDLEIEAAGLVRFSNYPAEFVSHQKLHRYFADDPVLIAAQRLARGFYWSEVPALIELSDRQEAIIALGARLGLGEGYTVPVHVPGEFAGSCSFGVRAGRAINREATPWLHYLGTFAFEAARRITRGTQRGNRRGLKLSERQRDCVVLLAKGATARQTATRLGIKQDTVQKHIGEAKARCGVRSTTQLVVRSLFDGAITFHDLLEAKIH